MRKTGGRSFQTGAFHVVFGLPDRSGAILEGKRFSAMTAGWQRLPHGMRDASINRFPSAKSIVPPESTLTEVTRRQSQTERGSASSGILR